MEDSTQTIILALTALFTAGSAFFAGWGLWRNARQTRLNNKLAEAKLVYDSFYVFLGDKIMQEAFYKIEYSQFRYGRDFHGSEEERRTDRLLRHFSNLAVLWQDGLLDLKYIHPVQYYILRIAGNDEIEKYLSYLIDEWTEGEHPYSALRSLAEALDSQPPRSVL